MKKWRKGISVAVSVACMLVIVGMCAFGVYAATSNWVKNSRTWTQDAFNKNNPYDHDLIGTSNVDYDKEFVYDSTTLDSPGSFYALTGWHIDESYGTKGSTTGNNGGMRTFSTGSKNLTNHINGTPNVSNGYSYEKDQIHLFVKWVKNTYVIKYDGNNTSTNIYGDPMSSTYTGSTPDTNAEYDSPVTINNNGFSRDGYTFKEWNTKPDGTGWAYAGGQTLIPGTDYYGSSLKGGFTDVNNGTVTLYAIWEPIKYTVVLNPNSVTKADGDNTNGSNDVSLVGTFDYWGTSIVTASPVSNHAGWGKVGYNPPESGSYTVNPQYGYVVRMDQTLTGVTLPSTSADNHAFVSWARYSQGSEHSSQNGGVSSGLNEIYYETGSCSIGSGGASIRIAKVNTTVATTISKSNIVFNPLTDRAGDGNFYIHAWYNMLPIFADVYDGQFFQGQRVSYQDLRDLVSVFDYENDYRNAVLEKIYSLPTIDESEIYLPVHVQEGGGNADNLGDGYTEDNNEVNTDLPEYVLDTDHWEDATIETVLGKKVVRYKNKDDGQYYYTVESRMVLEDSIQDSEVYIKIKDIAYEVSNGTVLTGEWDHYMAGIKHGVPVSGAVPEKYWTSGHEDDLERYYWLDTSSRRINKSSLYSGDVVNAYSDAVGHFTITFEATDGGITCGGLLVDNDPSGEVSSAVTVEYSRLCTIQYNAIPQIYIRNMSLYEGATSLGINDVLNTQLILDSEDCVNNPPWWYTKAETAMEGITVDSNTAKTYHGNIIHDRALNTNYRQNSWSSYNDLQLTLQERFVWGVSVNYYLEREYPGINNAVANWVNSGIYLADINALKGDSSQFSYGGTTYGCSRNDVYDAILSFNICIDGRDQWGKWASGAISQQNPWNPDDPRDPDDPSNPPNRDFPIDPSDPDDPDKPTPGGGDPNDPEDNDPGQPEPDPPKEDPYKDPVPPADPDGNGYTLTVKYVDIDGVSINADDVYTNRKKGSAYSVASKTITGYEYIGTGFGSNSSIGIMDSDKTVIFVYKSEGEGEKPKKDPDPTHVRYDLTVKYLTTDGTELLSPVVYSKCLENSEYNVLPVKIDGYDYAGLGAGSDARKGIMNSDKVVIFTYSPTPPEPTPGPDDGQSIIKRSVTIYKINPDTEEDLTQANIIEKVRFINDRWMPRIDPDSYWGDTKYGRGTLQGILDAKENSKDKSSTDYTGNFINKNGNKVPVTVHDYSE